MASVLRFALCCLYPFSDAFSEVLNLEENLISDIQKLPRLEFEGFACYLGHGESGDR